MSCEQLFKQQLKKKGLRLTNQRKAVLEILHETNGPVSADEIYKMIGQKKPGFDLSTVYRTLELLKEIGLVQEIHTNDRLHFYEHTGNHKPHIHLVCQHCGKIFTADQSLFKEIQKKLSLDLGFQPDWSQMTVPGICESCQSSK